MSKFADRLLQLRQEANLTQEELSNSLNLKYNLGTNKGMISKYEKGLHVPGFTFVDYVADYFGVTTDYLMGRSNNKYYDDNTHDKRIPILGTISAGLPIIAQENIIGYEYTSDNCDFCLRVKGDSMINARIHDGDIVYVKKQSDVENGEIAVVIIDGEEATLKRVYKINGNVILHPENPIYKDMIFSKKDFKQVQIIGKVKYVKAEVR